jgi:2-methylcitrate dehydratase PrpD
VELDAAKSLHALGQEWHFDQGTYKYFPSCFCNHAAIVAAQRAAGRLMAPAEISECTVRITPFAARLVGAPFDPGANPQVSAQFSAQYSVANALLRGGLSVADISPAAVMDAQVLGLAQRIRIEIDESASANYTPAVVEIRLHDGTERSARVDTIPGTPAQPATHAELIDKVKAGFETGPAALTPAQFGQLASRVEGLEAFGGMGSFWSFLPVKH